jgi:hypothetical protein
MMRYSLLILLSLVALTLGLPYKHQLALVNSLEVGRDEDPMVWSCVGCDADNKPLRSYLVQETSVEIRAILSIYEEYTVLAFRYTANAKNIFQDVLYPLQVDLLPLSTKTTMPPQDARFRRSTTICGRKSGRTWSTT